MNRKISILFVSLFVMIGLRDVFNTLYFYSNQEYIAEIYCINKNRPLNNCNGVCFLSQQFQDRIIGESQSNFFKQLFDHLELKILPIHDMTSAFLNKRLKGKSRRDFNEELYCSGYYPVHFHPPPGNQVNIKMMIMKSYLL